MELCPCIQHHRPRGGHDDGAHSSARQPCCHSLDRIAAGNHAPYVLELLTHSFLQLPVFFTDNAFVPRFWTMIPLYASLSAEHCNASARGTQWSGAGWVQVLGGIVYGGRITDAADMHVLVALLRRFLRPELMDDNFAFASDRAYSRPPVGSLQSYRYLPVHCSLLHVSTASLAT